MQPNGDLTRQPRPWGRVSTFRLETFSDSVFAGRLDPHGVPLRARLLVWAGGPLGGAGLGLQPLWRERAHRRPVARHLQPCRWRRRRPAGSQRGLHHVRLRLGRDHRLAPDPGPARRSGRRLTAGRAHAPNRWQPPGPGTDRDSGTLTGLISVSGFGHPGAFGEPSCRSRVDAVARSGRRAARLAGSPGDRWTPGPAVLGEDQGVHQTGSIPAPAQHTDQRDRFPEEAPLMDEDPTTPRRSRRSVAAASGWSAARTSRPARSTARSRRGGPGASRPGTGAVLAVN
jgi:hypothetical protein